jgi:hypothetical protein
MYSIATSNQCIYVGVLILGKSILYCLSKGTINEVPQTKYSLRL